MYDLTTLMMPSPFLYDVCTAVLQWKLNVYDNCGLRLTKLNTNFLPISTRDEEKK